MRGTHLRKDRHTLIPSLFLFLLRKNHGQPESTLKKKPDPCEKKFQEESRSRKGSERTRSKKDTSRTPSLEGRGERYGTFESFTPLGVGLLGEGCVAGEENLSREIVLAKGGLRPNGTKDRKAARKKGPGPASSRPRPFRIEGGTSWSPCTGIPKRRNHSPGYKRPRFNGWHRNSNFPSPEKDVLGWKPAKGKAPPRRRVNTKTRGGLRGGGDSENKVHHRGKKNKHLYVVENCHAVGVGPFAKGVEAINHDPEGIFSTRGNQLSPGKKKEKHRRRFGGKSLEGWL